MLPFKKELKPLARNLRSNMTDAEQLIWSKIRKKQICDVQFYRQKNIGNYIVDFYCPKGKLVIEIDGGQHYEKERMKKDRERDDYLQGLGLNIMRFSDIDVLKNINGVLERIHEYLKISPNPSLEKRGTR
jgi:very-short-patch-repair endonuclease